MGQLPLETRLLKREVGRHEYQKYYADELPRHKVCVNGFWIGATEVTQKEWVKIMGFNPAHFNTNENFPVDSVSWEDANNFINKLNTENKTNEFRLPSEAEWEFGARGNTEDAMYHTGNSITTEQANFNGSIAFGLNLREEYRKSPVEADSFAPNPFGLQNMHGNVWEWCKDWYGENYYANSPAKNPLGPKKGEMRVLRGGSWFRYSGHIRSATRYKNKPTGQYADTGFRIVKSQEEAVEESTDKFIFSPDF
ncbi:MAG: formylglycine-generating enzyme family protein [Desulfobulbaceae bacterium]|nr:formylglycine-generating enzyme family protein [Desulfobulbaceae bacterium]